MKLKTQLWAMLICGSLAAQELEVGLRFQKTQNMYWENGISAQYTFKNFKPRQFYVGFDYYSSRLGTAMGSNAIKQDNILFSAGWQFWKDQNFHIMTKLNLGYLVADYEYEIFDILPNTAFLLSPQVDLSYELPWLPAKAQLGIGYFINVQEESKSPGTFQPLYYHLSVYYQFFKPKKQTQP